MSDRPGIMPGVSLAPYRQVLAVPGVRTLLLLGILARVPSTAIAITLTLHVTDALGRNWAQAGLVTAAYTVESNELAGFESGLSDVARRHGVTDWEADDVTYAAIGAGLQRARVSAAERVRWEQAIGRGCDEKVALIRNGYGS